MLPYSHKVKGLPLLTVVDALILVPNMDQRKMVVAISGACAMVRAC
jgi:hypothetical protein